MPFRFLDLSAELRNLIYTFATADFDPTCRHSLALTQVCTQIRAECLHLYLTTFPTLPLSQLLSFLAAFLPVTSVTLMSKFAANLTVDASRDTVHWSKDILSTLRLLTAAPNVRVSMAYPHWPGESGMLEKLGAAMDAWCTILASDVISRIEVGSAEKEEHAYFVIYLSKDPELERVLFANTTRTLPGRCAVEAQRWVVTKRRGVDSWMRNVRIREKGGKEALLLDYLREMKEEGREDEWCRAWRRIMEVFKPWEGEDARIPRGFWVCGLEL